MYLLDSDILIHALRGHATVTERLREHRDAPKALSVLTYGELLYGARKSQRVAEHLAKVYRIAELFPLIPVTRAIVEGFAELQATLESKGESLDHVDLMIGVTALSLNYVLVTNNERHFRRISGLRIENWTK
jgi:tRNA(fMet)-specific endonuclease VapC